MGPGLQLFFRNITLASGTDFNVSKENVFICFNAITNEQCSPLSPSIFKHY